MHVRKYVELKLQVDVIAMGKVAGTVIGVVTDKVRFLLIKLVRFYLAIEFP